MSEISSKVSKPNTVRVWAAGAIAVTLGGFATACSNGNAEPVRVNAAGAELSGTQFKVDGRSAGSLAIRAPIYDQKAPLARSASSHGAQLGWLVYGTKITVDCAAQGDPVKHPNGAETTAWAVGVTEPQVGYFDINGKEAKAPDEGLGVLISGGDLEFEQALGEIKACEPTD